MTMKFVTGKKYVDRTGTIYTFREKVGGVTTFENEVGIPMCRNEKGMYRWDDKETPLDIVAE